MRRLARENKGEAIGAAFEIEQREAIGLIRLGMIHALRHAPGAGLLAKCRRGVRHVPGIERLDPQTL